MTERLRASVRVASSFVVAILASACGSSGQGVTPDAGGAVPEAAAPDAVAEAPARDASVSDVHVEPHMVQRGRGCGLALPPETNLSTGNQRFTQFKVTRTGANLTDTPNVAKAGPRSFWVRVPADYDRERAYRVVFVAPGCTTPEMAYASSLGLFKEAAGGTEQAIYVAIDVDTDGTQPVCADDGDAMRSPDWEDFELMMSFVDQHYCADLDAVYAVGYGVGTTLVNRWGCYFGGGPDSTRKFAPAYHLRAQVALWGSEPVQQPTCAGAVAAFFMRGTLGAISPITYTTPSLERVGLQNGCTTAYDDTSAQAPWHDGDLPQGACQSFVGCPAAAPVVLCRPAIPAQVGAYDSFSIPALKKFFDELEGHL